MNPLPLDITTDDLAAELTGDAYTLHRIRVAREHGSIRWPWNHNVGAKPAERVWGLVDPCLASAVRRNAPGWKLEADLDRKGRLVGMMLIPLVGAPACWEIKVTAKRVTVLDGDGDRCGTALLDRGGNDALDLLAEVLAAEITRSRSTAPSRQF